MRVLGNRVKTYLAGEVQVVEGWVGEAWTRERLGRVGKYTYGGAGRKVCHTALNSAKQNSTTA
jgi:hypothetical protein